MSRNKLKITLEKLANDFCKYGKTLCGICGGKLVYIRGRHPNEPRRKVCPTCCQEKLEQIHEISDKDYGKSYTARRNCYEQEKIEEAKFSGMDR